MIPKLRIEKNGRIFILNILISIIGLIFIIFLLSFYYRREITIQFFKNLSIKQVFIDLKDSIISISKSSPQQN